MEAVWFFGLVASIRSRWLFLFQRWFMACSLYAQTPRQKAPLSPLVFIVYHSLLGQLGLFGDQEVGELSVWAHDGFIVFAIEGEDDFSHVRMDDFPLPKVLAGALKARKNDIPVKVRLLLLCVCVFILCFLSKL
ncbi:hypothetical protein Hanom_Chr12g01115661 [Helianthus anomalus]